MSLGMQKIQFEEKNINRKRSKCDKQISKKRLHPVTYLRLQLVFLLCLLASELILTVCYIIMFPRIGDKGRHGAHPPPESGV